MATTDRCDEPVDSNSVLDSFNSEASDNASAKRNEIELQQVNPTINGDKALNSSKQSIVEISSEKVNLFEVSGHGYKGMERCSSLEEKAPDSRIIDIEKKLENMEAGKMLEQSNRGPSVVGKRKHFEIQKNVEVLDHKDESTYDNSIRQKRHDLQSIISQYEKEMEQKNEELDSLRTSYQLLKTDLSSLNIWKDETEKQKKEIEELKEENDILKEHNNKQRKEFYEAKLRISRELTDLKASHMSLILESIMLKEMREADEKKMTQMRSNLSIANFKLIMLEDMLLVYCFLLILITILLVCSGVHSGKHCPIPKSH